MNVLLLAADCFNTYRPKSAERVSVGVNAFQPGGEIVARRQHRDHGAQQRHHQAVHDHGLGVVGHEDPQREKAGGLFLAAIILGCIRFLCAITGASWFSSIISHLPIWYLSMAGAGALIGFLARTFLGSAAGAIFGGIRSLARH
jgi:hypothetical protein